MRLAFLLAQYPDAELDIRRDAVVEATPPGVEIEFRQYDASVYRKGLTNFHRAIAAPMVARLAVDAQQDGFDAIVPYGTLDLGVEEARHVVDIPILGPGRTAAMTAATLAERFAVLCYDQPHAVMFRRLLRAWRVESFVTSIEPIDLFVTDMAREPEALRQRFVDTAAAVLQRDEAELILPLGMTMVPVLLSAEELTKAIGAPVLDPLAITLHAAHALARTGYTNSRIAYPAVQLD